MAYRTFVDRDGTYWQAWDSQPTRVERRMSSGDRRQPKPKYFAWGGTERRSGTDRRTTSQRRITLVDGYGAGWLTFESLQERRRVIPIPFHWEELSQDGLRSLCENARRVSKNDGQATG